MSDLRPRHGDHHGGRSTPERDRTASVARRRTMFEYVTETPADAETSDRVAVSATRLYGRLNPPVRDPEIPHGTPALPIYDWEIVADTGIDIDAVRLSLRSLDGRRITVAAVNDEHSVVALAPYADSDAA
jgi:hypothetical protein